MILPSINTAVGRKKIQRYFRKLSQQFSCNKGRLLVLVFLYYYYSCFLSGLGFSTRAGLESACLAGLGCAKAVVIVRVTLQQRQWVLEGGGRSQPQLHEGMAGFHSYREPSRVLGLF